MPLAPGDFLGHYQITAAIGAGGMGEVYRARDIKLGRDVAIKVLPPVFASQPDRIARFEREAQALAALNHPNIAQIYGTEGHAPVDPARGAPGETRNALVMEFVPGDDLARTIARGPLAVDETLGIARQIALALEAAHAVSIIHRDLKPANVKVNADGVVKVLDFGLARIGTPDGASGDPNVANSPTMTSPATTLGVILGTAAYMAPEQARGRAVDKRADIWAFGCVFYEMLAGKPAFTGETVTDVLAAVVSKDPDWSQLPAETPASVRRLLTRCLRKDPRQRLHDIADARLEIDAAATVDDASAIAPAATMARVSPRRRWAAIAAIAIAAAAIGAVGGIAWRASRDTPPPEWTATHLGGPSIAMYPRVSPDGYLLAFLAMIEGQSQVAVMKPSAGSWTTLTHDRTRGLVDTLSWAADGSVIYFDRITDVPNGIYSVPPLGGDERLVIENAGSPEALTDGSLLFVRTNADRVPQLHRFWPGTGRIEPLPVVPALRSAARLAARQLDNDRLVLHGRALDRSGTTDGLMVLTLSTKALHPLPATIDGAILGIAFDRSNATILASVVEGSMVRIVSLSADEAVPAKSMLTVLQEFPAMDVGANGELYLGLMGRSGEILQVDARDGHAELVASPPIVCGAAASLPDGRVLVPTCPGRVMVAPPGREPYRFVQTDEPTTWPIVVLPDGNVALVVGEGEKRDIAIVSGDSGRILRRVKAPADLRTLESSRDGRTLYVAAGRSISAMPIDGGAARQICAGDSVVVDPASGDLVVMLVEETGLRLMRCSIKDGSTREHRYRGEYRLIPEPLSAGSIRNGRLLVPLSSNDSWYWFLGSLDLATGHVERIKVDYFTDFHYLTWMADGKVLGTGLGVRSALWKFERKQ